ncbi:MAG: hypothetical protein ABH849_02195 [Nanoarchaeota archaeon]
MKEVQTTLILTFFLIIISLLAPIIMHFYVNDVPTGKATTQGSVSLIVVDADVCGNGLCEAEEDCASCPEDCGVCPVVVPISGGGGGSTPPVRRKPIDFTFTPDNIDEKLVQGEAILVPVTVKNIGTQDFVIDFSIFEIGNLVFLDENYLELDRYESKNITVLLSVGHDEKPGIYLGDIVGKVGDFEKRLPILLTITERGALIEVEIELDENNKVIRPGTTISAITYVLNNLNENISVDIAFSIRNKDKEILDSFVDKVTLKKGQNVFEESFEIPRDFELGYYLYYVELNYGSSIYSDAASFRVESPLELPGLLGFNIYIKIGTAIIATLILLYLFMRFVYKRRTTKKKDKKIIVVDKLKLVVSTTNKLIGIRSELRNTYNRALLERYFKVIRHFFAFYFSIKYSLTFEELMNDLNEKDVEGKSLAISFIKKIAHIPYYDILVPKEDFARMIEDTITILNFYKKEQERLFELNKKSKKFGKKLINSNKKKINIKKQTVNKQ